MNYKAIVAIMDDVPYSSGDVLSDNVQVPERPIPVLMDSKMLTNEVDAFVGWAIISKLDGVLEAEISINENRLSSEKVQSTYGTVSGYCLERNGNIVSKWKLKEIFLTFLPSDKRLPKLKLL